MTYFRIFFSFLLNFWYLCLSLDFVYSAMYLLLLLNVMVRKKLVKQCWSSIHIFYYLLVRCFKKVSSYVACVYNSPQNCCFFYKYIYYINILYICSSFLTFDLDLQCYIFCILFWSTSNVNINYMKANYVLMFLKLCN